MSYEIRGGSGKVYYSGTFDEMLYIYDSPECELPLPMDDEPLVLVRKGTQTIDPRLKDIFG